MIQFPINIKEFVRDGDGRFDPKEIGDTQQLLEQAGYLLDKSYSNDICGDVLFKGEDGVMYVLSVEAVINEASLGYVELMQTRNEEEASQAKFLEEKKKEKDEKDA